MPPAIKPDDVLLVEDHADTQEILVHLLTEQGYSVLTADNGQQALDLLERGIRPRLIVVDLMLPRVSGSDLLSVLRADAELRQTPIVVITAAPKDSFHVIADAILRKPLDYAKLLTTIRNLMARRG